LTQKKTFNLDKSAESAIVFGLSESLSSLLDIFDLSYRPNLFPWTLSQSLFLWVIAAVIVVVALDVVDIVVGVDVVGVGDHILDNGVVGIVGTGAMLLLLLLLLWLWVMVKKSMQVFCPLRNFLMWLWFCK